MKNIRNIVLVFFCSIMFTILAACKDDPPPKTPENPYTPENPINLPEQSFDSALDAFNFGKEFFDNAKNYETTYYGTAKPQKVAAIAGNQLIYTRSYLSQNGDFLYDNANYALSESTIFGDPSYVFLVAMKSGEDNVYHEMFRTKSRTSKVENILYSDYSDLSLSDLDTKDMADFENTSGGNPRKLINYVVNESTIDSVEYFNKGGDSDEFAYTFKFKMKEEAHGENYRKQVKFNSSYDYKEFKQLSIEFKMDKYGRILQVSTYEKYSINAPLTPEIVVEGTQYITYSKNPLINFDGFTVSYNEA